MRQACLETAEALEQPLEAIRDAREEIRFALDQLNEKLKGMGATQVLEPEELEDQLLNLDSTGEMCRRVDGGGRLRCGG